MRGTYGLLVALAAAATALPAHGKFGGGNIKADTKGNGTITADDNKMGHDLGVDPKEVLAQIQDLFEQTCHKVCLMKFPEAGPKQDFCMRICHHNHPDSDHDGIPDDMDDDMGGDGGDAGGDGMGDGM
ncbi:hypothetical protein F4778DRAFT_781151 [Xylariomycetidae sp. FL2044]|nr:hypothetical protein F4778DRAFT_781151 [Xylariomycetidae sp. FL2044]